MEAEIEFGERILQNCTCQIKYELVNLLKSTIFLITIVR